MWDQLSPSTPHVAYLTISTFLILYALFSQFIKNKLHLSEPPLAVLFGIVLGPALLGILLPKAWGVKDEDDPMLKEITRVIVGIQCFFVGIELPKFYFYRHWLSVLYFLGPIMIFSWSLTSLFAYCIFHISISSALMIGACLSPTDPVLAASVLSNSHFSSRVPSRLRNLLSAESACNDGISYPLLFLGIFSLKYASASTVIKEWFLITVLYQCLLGITLGLLIGIVANRLLRYSFSRQYVTNSSFIVFYLLLSLLCVGIGSILGSDDFLVTFGAGVGFAHDGWFSQKTKEVPFPQILDLMLNSTMFVFFGAIIPWSKFRLREVTPEYTLWKLSLFSALVLLFRRIPVVLALKRWIPDIRTYREALFCGHFGPMGVGALFLALEARTKLLEEENELSQIDKLSEKANAAHLLWPVICFVVLCSIFVHGLSTVMISIGGHFSRRTEERAPLLGQETEGLAGMVHEWESDSEPEISGSDLGDR